MCNAQAQDYGQMGNKSLVNQIRIATDVTKPNNFKLLGFDFVIDTSDTALNTCARLGFAMHK